MRVLITGATGFLGYHLCARLLSLGHQVTAFHRAQSHTERIAALGVGLIQGELGDLDGLHRAVAGHDAVIHAAAVKFTSSQPELQEQVNVVGTRHVAQACRLEGKRLVHVSTTSAIGIPEDRHPADETFVFNLSRLRLSYHITKHHAENEVLGQAAAGLDAVIVNPAWIFGPDGDRYRGREIICKVARTMVAPYFAGGVCVVHVDDVAAGLVAALQRGVRGRRYILGGENITYRDLARRSLEALGLRRPLIPVPPFITALLHTREAHYCSSHFQFYSSDRARVELGYAPRNFDAILRECLEVQSLPGGASAEEPRK